jgi:hypothetical protein
MNKQNLISDYLGKETWIELNKINVNTFLNHWCFPELCATSFWNKIVIFESLRVCHTTSVLLMKVV